MGVSKSEFEMGIFFRFQQMKNMIIPPEHHMYVYDGLCSLFSALDLSSLLALHKTQKMPKAALSQGIGRILKISEK